MKSRNTKQKKTIEKELSKIDSFFTAQELYDKVNKVDKRISIATIYRYLKNLKENKSIFFYRCSGKEVYSRENKSHCHFVCEKTGKIIHFDIDSLDFLKDKIPGTISSFQIEVKGVCRDCLDD
jgi:Fur family ferric uptake transcriptional regulator